MREPALREVASFGDLVGYWQFPGDSGPQIAALERGDTSEQLSLYQLTNDRWELARRLPLEQPGARALDGYRLGTRVFLCIEVNGRHALELWAMDSGILVRGAAQGAASPTASLDLTQDAAREVEIPPSHWWNIATLLDMPGWLFSPRLVRGEVGEPLVIASTADGRAALLGPGKGGTVRGSPAIRRALEPQGVRIRGELLVAFQRPPEPDVYPFWLVPRHGKVALGDLIVSDGTNPEVNLSTVLGLGPVMRFALVPGRDGSPWLFALIDAPVGTDVVALERAQGTWRMRGRQSLDRELRDVSVEAGAGTGEWHLVYRIDADERSALEYQMWRIGK